MFQALRLISGFLKKLFFLQHPCMKAFLRYETLRITFFCKRYKHNGVMNIYHETLFSHSHDYTAKKSCATTVYITMSLTKNLMQLLSRD